MNLKLTKHVTKNYPENSNKKFCQKHIKQKEFNYSFDNILKKLIFFQNSKIFIGVSGGSDSMLLSLFIKRWAEINQRKFQGIIVDHGLRKKSFEEAVITQRRLNSLGIQSNIFKLNPNDKRSGVQEWARYERMSLLTGITSMERGILLLGHHLNDQVETILMRMKKNTGFKGAGGINPIIEWYGVPIIRPMLRFSKSQILSTCVHNKISFESDMSNFDEKYERVRERNILEKLNSKIFSLQCFDRMSLAIRKINKEFDNALSKSMFGNVNVDKLGWCEINFQWFMMLHQIVAKKILSTFLKMIGGQRYPSHRNKIDNIYEYIINHFQNDVKFCNRTIAGCKIRKWKNKLILVRIPNQNNQIMKIPLWKKLIFDGRWIISGNIGDEFSYPNYNQAIKIRKTIDPQKKYPWEIWSSIPLKINANKALDCIFNLDEMTKGTHLIDSIYGFNKKHLKIEFNEYSQN